MLVLTRKLNEGVKIGVGGAIRVWILDAKLGTNGVPIVQLGIDAPPEVPIHRDEVVEKIRQDGRNPDTTFSKSHTARYSPGGRPTT